MTITSRRDLWQLIQQPIGNAAELGVAEGRFSEEILRWPIKFPKVYLVDRWQQHKGQKGDGGHAQAWHDANLKQVCERVQPFGERAHLLIGDTVKMAEQVPNHSLSLLYIDADHSYEGVTRDLIAWVGRVKAGGIIAFHDYLNSSYGVNRAVREFATRFRFTINDIPETNPHDAGAWLRC